MRDGSPFAPTSALERRFLAAFALAVAISLPYLVHPWYDWTYSDAATYIETARALAAGDGYTHLERPFTLRPPGFSFVLAPAMAVFGKQFQVLNGITALFGAAGVLLLYWLMRGRLGWPLAMGVAAAVWLAPAYQKLGTQVMADVPGLAAILAALLVAAWADERPDWRREVALGLAIGAAAYLRSIAILLVPAIVAARAWRRWRAPASDLPLGRFVGQGLALFALVACLLLAPWSVRNDRVMGEPPADQTMAWSYWTGMWHRDRGDPGSPLIEPGALLTRARENAPRIAAFVGSRLTEVEPRPGTTALALVFLAGLLAMLIKRAEPTQVFALGVLFTTIVYYDVRDRLLLPIAVLGFAAAAESLRDLLRRRLEPAVATGVALGVVLLAGALDAAPRKHWPRTQAMHENLVGRCRSIASQVPADARLATSFNWHYGVCLDRPVYSLLFTAQRAGWVPSVEKVIDDYEVDFVVLNAGHPADAALVRYFTDRYPDQSRDGRMIAVRVRPRPGAASAAGP